MIPLAEDYRNFKNEIQTLKTKISDLENQSYVTKEKALKTTGWYRIARLTTQIGHGISQIVQIKRNYNHAGNEVICIVVQFIYNKAQIKILSSLALTRLIKKARVVINNTNAYLDIQYDVGVSDNNENVVSVSSIMSKDFNLLDFEPVDDEGTICTTIDIVNT